MFIEELMLQVEDMCDPGLRHPIIIGGFRVWSGTLAESGDGILDISASWFNIWLKYK